MSVALTLPRLQARRLPVMVLFGVLALHAALLLGWTRAGVWPDRVSAREPAPVAKPPLMLWLLDRAAPRPTPAADPSPSQPRRRPPQAAAPSPRSPYPASGEAQAITLPSAPAEPQQAPAAATDAASATGPAPSALNLTLPRAASAAWRQRSPALDDARANTRAPASMAALIDQALGGDPRGPISEEPLADGSVRFRRGSQCVISRPNQAQNLDPYNGSVLPKPRLLDKC